MSDALTIHVTWDNVTGAYRSETSSVKGLGEVRADSRTEFEETALDIVSTAGHRRREVEFVYPNGDTVRYDGSPKLAA